MGDSPPYWDSSHVPTDGESIIEKQFKLLNADKNFITGRGVTEEFDESIEKVVRPPPCALTFLPYHVFVLSPRSMFFSEPNFDFITTKRARNSGGSYSHVDAVEWRSRWAAGYGIAFAKDIVSV